MLNSVTWIQDNAFWGCSNLTFVDIPNSVTHIGVSAFENCTGLTSIIIHTSVKSIEEYTFGRCSSLTAIEIPSNVKRIKWNAFWGGKLKELHIHHEHPEQMDVDEDAFGEMAENCTLYVPVGTGYAYRHHPVFGKFKEVIIERIKE